MLNQRSSYSLQPGGGSLARLLFFALFLCILTVSVSAQRASWSRGIQHFQVTMTECQNRARGALLGEGYAIENEGGSFSGDFFYGGYKGLNNAAIACNLWADGRVWANVFVSGPGRDGSAAGEERIKLQTRMGQPGGGGGSTGSVFGGIWDVYAWDVMTMDQTGNQVTGKYTGLGSGTFQGTVRDGKLYFSFRNAAGGVGTAVMSPIDANAGRYGINYCDGVGCDPLKQGFVGAQKRR